MNQYPGVPNKPTVVQYTVQGVFFSWTPLKSLSIKINPIIMATYDLSINQLFFRSKTMS